MAFELSAIQHALREDGLDGWLLYDFHGSNPIARGVAGLRGNAKLTTRRWYYLVPASGAPRALVHGIERDALAHLPGEQRTYAGRAALEAGLAGLLQGMRRIAMEYSPACAIPYVSRVDAGTVERIRSLGAEVVSSGDLVQRFEAVWDDAALASHRAASERLYAIKDRAFALIRDRVAGGALTEHAVQQKMVEWFGDAGLITDCPPVVAAQESSGNPHYLPTAASHRPVRPGQVVLLDLWGKLDRPGAVYADITWVCFTGSDVPARAAAVRARGRLLPRQRKLLPPRRMCGPEMGCQRWQATEQKRHPTRRTVMAQRLRFPARNETAAPHGARPKWAMGSCAPPW